MGVLFNKDIFKGVLSNIYTWILFLVVAAVSAFIISLLAGDSGLAYYQVGLIFVATFAAVGISLVCFAIVLPKLFRRKQADRPEIEAGQAQQGGVHFHVNNAPVFNNSPRIDQSPTVNQSPRQTLTQHAGAQPSKPPVIDALPGWIERTKSEQTGEVASQYRIRYAHLYQVPELIETGVVFAKFHRDVDGSDDAWVDVRAYVEFFNPDGNFLYRIDEAFWRNPTGDHKQRATFHIGDTHILIVAIVGKGGIYPYAGRYLKVGRRGLNEMTEFELDTINNPLKGSDFVVRVTLIGTKGGQARLKQSLEYDLIEPSGVFRLRPAKPPLP